jgi:hypothetical protein
MGERTSGELEALVDLVPTPCEIGPREASEPRPDGSGLLVREQQSNVTLEHLQASKSAPVQAERGKVTWYSRSRSCGHRDGTHLPP